MEGLVGFFTKQFSTNAIWSRLIRSLMLASSAYTVTAGQDTATRVIAVATAFLGGMVSAGQNNPPPSAPPEEKQVPVTKTA